MTTSPNTRGNRRLSAPTGNIAGSKAINALAQEAMTVDVTTTRDVAVAPKSSAEAERNGSTRRLIHSPLRHLDADAVSESARRESRNRELHLPPIGVYRWWARRTESVNGALIEAVNIDLPGQLNVSDPFSGGGVIPLAAVIRGHNVYAQDLSLWAAQGLRTMLDLPDPERLRDGIAALTQRVNSIAEAAYGTVLSDGSRGHVAHTFRVAVAACTVCGYRQRMFPHATVSLLARAERRQPEAFLACRNGHVFRGTTAATCVCPDCESVVDPADLYTRGRFVVCNGCGHKEKLEARLSASGANWDVVLVERAGNRRRELDVPRDAEIRQANHRKWEPSRQLGEIPDGHETKVLTRHGFRNWQDLYPKRQRWFTEKLLAMVADSSTDDKVQAALTSAVIGATEMAGLLSRWDRFYLKSYESMANHRFNFTTFTAEPNVWGTVSSGRGTVLRRLVRLVRSSEWAHEHAQPVRIIGPINTAEPAHAQLTGVVVANGTSERQALPDDSIHLALTDPPYHDDVQYQELSLPLRAWAGLPLEQEAGDAAVNPTTTAGSSAALLSRIFREIARTLRPDGHLIFSFANRDLRGWTDLIDALHYAGLRAAGAEILHSENESDHAKRNVRACTLDLILDLVPQGPAPIVQHRPRAVDTDEGRFLTAVARYVLRIGELEPGWQASFKDTIAAEPFVAAPTPRRPATPHPTGDPAATDALPK